jgi:uncharacterized damage-inducible protein DinB
MAEPNAQGYIQSINTSIDSILKTTEDLSVEVIRWNPTEDEWSILQILSHLAEATPFWLTEVERVLEKPGSEWGRGLQHKERLAAVEAPDELNLDEVLSKMEGLKEQVMERLSNISDSRLTEENPHRNFAKFGNKPISFIIEHFIDEHIAKHLGQIERNLSKLSGTTK